MIACLKWCSRCGIEKDIEDFYTRKASSDGKCSACKTCIDKEHRIWEHTSTGRTSRRKSQKKRRATPNGKRKTKEYNKTSYETQRFSRSKTIARRRKQPWDLTENEYLNLVGQQCHYCQGALPTGGIGLDRINNTKGYVEGNVLPCCTHCNCARADFFTVAEMETIIGPAIKAILASRS